MTQQEERFVQMELPWERMEAVAMPSSLGSRSISVGRQVVSE